MFVYILVAALHGEINIVAFSTSDKCLDAIERVRTRYGELDAKRSVCLKREVIK
jgi:hypothetical protein